MTVPLRFVTEPLRFHYSSLTVSLRFVTPYYAFVTAPRLREKKKQAHKQSKSHKQSKNEVEARRSSSSCPGARGKARKHLEVSPSGSQAGCRGRSPRRGYRGCPPVSKNVGGWAGGTTASATIGPLPPPGAALRPVARSAGATRERRGCSLPPCLVALRCGVRPR